MSEIKLKIVLNKGRHGILMHKLAQIAEEAEKFLSYFSEDLELDKTEWVADSFKNGSLSFTANYVGNTSSESQVTRANKALVHVVNPKIKPSELNGDLSQRTYAQFARIANPLDADDSIGLGVLNEKGKFTIKTLTKERAILIEREMSQVSEEFVGYQGSITALFKEGTCWLKDFVSGERIVCKYKPYQYKAIWKLLEDREGLADIEGWAVIKNGEIEQIKIESITPSAEYKEEDIDKFFGSSPSFTGGKPTGDYLAEIRDEEPN